ncbi:MAG: HD domain-containing protein [Spirochaetaceae bacterium]
MEEIDRVLNFIVEIEKLKNVLRKSKPVGCNRFENSAEHSWHVCLSALMLKDYANEDINIDRVIKMLLIHDLGEIDSGDKIIYESETLDNKEVEANGVKRLLNMLPEGMADIYVPLWYEFEEGKTIDSKYAKAIDRVPPLFHNLLGNGHTWKEHNISKTQVYTLNERISLGSKKLWEVIKVKLDLGVKQGLLKDE